MIAYEGIKQLNNDTYLLILSTTLYHDNVVRRTEIPIDRLTAERILKYVESILPPAPKKVEPQNDEPND